MVDWPNDVKRVNFVDLLSPIKISIPFLVDVTRSLSLSLSLLAVGLVKLAGQCDLPKLEYSGGVGGVRVSPKWNNNRVRLVSVSRQQRTPRTAIATIVKSRNACAEC